MIFLLSTLNDISSTETDIDGTAAGVALVLAVIVGFLAAGMRSSKLAREHGPSDEEIKQRVIINRILETQM